MNSDAKFSHFVNMVVYFQVRAVLRVPLIATSRYNDINLTVPRMSLQRGPTVTTCRAYLISYQAQDKSETYTVQRTFASAVQFQESLHTGVLPWHC